MADFDDVMNVVESRLATHRIEFFNDRTDTAERFDVSYPTDRQAVQAARTGHEYADTFYHGILVLRYVRFKDGRRGMKPIYKQG